MFILLNNFLIILGLCNILPINNSSVSSNYSVLNLLFNSTNYQSHEDGIYGIIYKNSSKSQLYFSGPIQPK